MSFFKQEPSKESYTLSNDVFNHCASVCPHKNGVLIAWYSGEFEANEKQKVNVAYWSKGEYSEILDIGSRTGNPVIWSVSNKRACLLYSYFEQLTRRTVMRWKYCSNWIVPIEYRPSRKEIWASYVHSRLELEPSIGFLGRCQPIKIGKEWLLPLYKEHDPYGLIMESENGWDWSPRSKIGESDSDNKNRFGQGLLIQPTLWSDESRLFALCRDITGAGRSWFMQSYDMGRTWSEPVQTSIPNHNNSLVALHDGTDNPWLVWNADRRRKELVLGKINGTDAVSFFKLNQNQKGSYPNYCVDNDGLIHIVHSDHPVIRHHVFNRSWLENLEKEKLLDAE